MPSNNTKYSEEMREQTAAYIIETGKSATSIGLRRKCDTQKNIKCDIICILEGEKYAKY